MIKHDKIYKINIVFSFHRIREVTEANIISCYFISRERNPGDILYKYYIINIFHLYFNLYNFSKVILGI